MSIKNNVTSLIKQSLVISAIIAIWLIPFMVFCKSYANVIHLQYMSIVAVVWWLIGVTIIGMVMEKMSKAKQHKSWN